ncbi:ABC transporter ATP-binding protein [Streptomyces sp. NPDC020917]|uniref:ABC transporter ATP-binding protein n=1 Tax=Streptomyces sp. NPDC020917 TaxID=3365102 RepID=UPI003791FB27
MSSQRLEIEDLTVAYGHGRKQRDVLHGVSLSISAGETFGLVGESGSGKTTLGRAVLGLVPTRSGTIRYNGGDITRAAASDRRSLAHDVQVVFQDPYTSLNPAMTIRNILTEPLRVRGVSKADADRRVRDLLDRVAMPADVLGRHARDFSGGQRQRIAIARALALDPGLIVCDEPVSALDLSTQLRALDLLIDIQEKTGVSYLFISHDLAVVRHISHSVAVMRRGEIVENGRTEAVTEHPQHPYTQRLWASNLVADPIEQAERRRIRAETMSEPAA